MDRARRDGDWPYFPDEPGAVCKLCGEGPDAHRGLRTHLTSGLYCNALGKQMLLCCNCGKDHDVSFFFAHSCADCEARRLQHLHLQRRMHGAPAHHLLVLCHGLYGLPSELYAARDKLRGVPGCVVHCCESYGGAGTMQGINEIGERIRAEVCTVIDAHLSDRPALATISFVGHSMGGVVARSAISKLFNGSDGTIHGMSITHQFSRIVYTILQYIYRSELHHYRPQASALRHHGVAASGRFQLRALATTAGGAHCTARLGLRGQERP
jgi:hypothetical protein